MSENAVFVIAKKVCFCFTGGGSSGIRADTNTLSGFVLPRQARKYHYNGCYPAVIPEKGSFYDR
jgi:hypothetical protein